LKIYLMRTRATKEQMENMLQTLHTYIKVAVDVQREILAGGGEFHADCETVLLEDGSNQEDLWGADWYPSTQEIVYDALINIRPRQNNRSMKIGDPRIRERVTEIMHRLLGES